MEMNNVVFVDAVFHCKSLDGYSTITGTNSGTKMPSHEMKKIKILSEVTNVKFFNATIHK
jgi:hypothetical protein